MPWRCPVCGNLNPDDREYCEVCGAKKPNRIDSLSEELEAIKLQEKIDVDEKTIEKEHVEPTEGAEETKGQRPEARAIYLEIVNSPLNEFIGRKIPLLFNVFSQITLGRSPENVIIIPDPTVSRKHAIIKKEGDNIVLEDLGSTNGTYVYNESTNSFERVKRVELIEGTIIRLGEQTIIKIVSEPF